MKYKLFLIPSYFLLLFAYCKKNTGGRQNIILESGFEGNSSDYLAGWANEQHCCDYSVTQTSATARTGSSALRLEVRSTDPKVSNSIRSEIQPTVINDEGEMWYGFSYYFKDWIVDNAASSELQWHPNSSGGGATLSLRTTGGEYEIVHGSDATGFTYGTFPAPYRTVVPNVWVDFVFHVKWASENTGFIQVWKDGVLVYNKQNIRTDFGGQYLKVGINAFIWSGGQTDVATTRVFYIDDVRIGNARATYEDVKPGN